MRNDNIDKIFNEECLKLINSKNNDYANPTDFYANFRLSEQAGVPMFMGVHIRLLDKISRLNSFMERFNRTGKMSVEHESIEDTLLDTINYSAIALDTYRMWKHDNTSSSINTDNNDISLDALKQMNRQAQEKYWNKGGTVDRPNNWPSP